ncbi:MAG: trigger factor [Christensenellaceae bacterium]|nr:trigger factor [Christensenellaceae bacterium]
MKKFFAIILAVMMLFAFAGCADKDETPATEAAKTAETETAEESGFEGTDYKGNVTFANEDYKQLTVDLSANSYEVTEEAIDQKLASYLDYLAEWKDVTDRSIENGDTAKIDYVGSVDGVEFKGGSATDYDLEIGSHSFIDDFEEQLIGANIGDEVKVEVTFPEDYHAADLAGAEAVFMVTVKGISEYVIPEMSDETVEELGYKDLADARANAKAELEETMEQQRSADITDAIWAQIETITTLEFDEDEKQKYIDDIYAEYEGYAASAGADLETMIASFGMTIDDFNTYCDAQAETEIGYFMRVQALAEKLGITVDEASYEEGCKDLLAKMEVESRDAFEDTYGTTLEEYYTKAAIVDYVLSNEVKAELAKNAKVIG